MTEVIKKPGYFTVRLTVRGEGVGSALSALTLGKFENFDPFVQWNMTLGYSKHILSHCEGSQKCSFNAFNASAIPLSDRFVIEQ